MANTGPAIPPWGTPDGQPGASSGPVSTIDPASMANGDTVEIEGQSYRVVGQVHYTEDGDAWTEFVLEISDGPGAGSLVYLELEGRKWTLWHDIEGPFEPDPTVIADHRVHHHAASGEARFRSEGETDMPASGVVTYHDYKSEGPRERRTYFSLDRFGEGSWQPSLGRRIVPQTITVTRQG